MEKEWLPAYLPKQRWFGAKSRQIAATAISDWGHMGDLALALVEITYAGGDRDSYFVPLAISIGAAGDAVFKNQSSAILATVMTPEGSGYLHDGMFDDEAGRDFLTLIGDAGELTMHRGKVSGLPSANFAELRGEEALEPRLGSAEQSNTSILFGNRLILKIFRRQQAGPNPDTEIGRYLTEHSGFRAIPPFGGAVEYQPAAPAGEEGMSSTLAMLQGLVPNEGDGWEWTLEELQRYFELAAVNTMPEERYPRTHVSFTELSDHPESDWTREHVGTYLDAAALLGRRTAEMHLALAQPTEDAAFSPEPMTDADLEVLRTDLSAHANAAFDALRQNLSHLPAEVEEMSGLVLSRRRRVAERLGQVGYLSPSWLRTRVHGDYHLGQVLRTRGDFVILDFEGEPARALAERRAKQSPMKDVAGMLRSFSYAAYSGLMRVLTRRPGDADRLEPWARLWEQSVCGAFLRAYRLTMKTTDRGVVPAETEAFEQLLEIYVLDKALYELMYELNNRPAWVRIPLAGILALPLR
jgi:maltose alpha-D-glucosyltransferase/alpha-amylase